MNATEFIKEIVAYYRESRELTIDKGEFNIWRGVSHSISSQSEDLFAKMVAQELNDTSLEFIVDKTFLMRLTSGESMQFRPDLAIVKNGVLTKIIDLKMDMGYKRRYHETDAFKKEADKFTALRNQNYESISYSRGSKKFELKAAKNISNQIVVISEKNEGKSDNRLDMVSSISKLDWVEVYYLSGGVHPNTYDEAALKNLTVNESEFARLFADIRTNL